jgi:hypothetical protein
MQNFSHAYFSKHNSLGFCIRCSDIAFEPVFLVLRDETVFKSVRIRCGSRHDRQFSSAAEAAADEAKISTLREWNIV